MPLLRSIFGRTLGLDEFGRLVIRSAADTGNAKVMPRLLYTNTAASTAHSNTTTEAIFDTNYTIPANMLRAGSLLKMRWQGIAIATNSTDTLTIVARIGGLTGTALFTHAATDVADNNVFQGEYELIIRTVGASGTMVGCGWGKSVPAAEGTATFKDDILASTTIDTTVAQQVGVTADWSVANAGNSCRLDFFKVELW